MICLEFFNLKVVYHYFLGLSLALGLVFSYQVNAENESLAPLPTSEERSKASAKSQAESSNNKTDPLCAVKTSASRVLRIAWRYH